MFKHLRSLVKSNLGAGLLAFVLTISGVANVHAASTALSDTPVYSASSVPSNLMLALSVEFPTGLVAAYKGTNDYSSATKYLGYFDNVKCYDYDTSNGWFKPANTNGPVCSGRWSGNMLNWATMAALDEFRQALTGGNRGTDTTSTTVLLRSNLTTQGSYSTNFPDKSVNATGNVGDSFTGTVYFRSGGQGTKILVSNNSSFTNLLLSRTVTYNAQVKVCDPNFLEANCNSAHDAGDYPGAGVYNKPDGLIQQNFTKIRVGASAYAFLNGNGSGQGNGVVRALLRDNGPTTYNGNAARTANPYKEWDATTGIFPINPDTADTTGKAPGGGNATQTGAINYLNKFGYTSSGYETYDTISDLYWATLAYYMQVPIDAGYTKNLTAGNSLDPAFPVFGGTPPNDPISYSCQANAIVTIGDDHTHYDTRVPGGTLTSAVAGGGLPIIPVSGTVPPVDAATWTTTMGNLPLIEGTTPATKTYSGYWSTSNPALGGLVWGDQGTYYMPGLAYYAHVNDIRNDPPPPDPNDQKVQNTVGKQTVDTYAVDVLEPGIYDGTTNNEIYNPGRLSSAGPNIYWLAAKYGGFNDINSNGIPANFLTWHTNSTTVTAKTLRPDNFFLGNQPDLLQAGLLQIFNKVASTSIARGAAPSVTSTRALTAIPTGVAPYFSNVSGFPIYNVQYKPISWDGDVTGFIGAATAGSDVTQVPGSATWSAQAQLENLTQSLSGTTVIGWDTGRRIITSNTNGASSTPGVSPGVPFRYLSLPAAEQSTVSASLVNFLRGDKSGEAVTYHVRNHVLGDIVNSQAVLVQGASSPSYAEATNPGYTAFSTSLLNRQPVVYTGSNDGMLHAFDADFTTSTPTNLVTGGGSELFAYVPSILFKGPNNTPQVDGLAALANLTGVSTNPWSHRFYVDATPQVADIDFQYTGLNPTASTAATSKWQSILVDGLGKGGKGIFALNITTVPGAISTTGSNSTSSADGETNLSQSKVMWEFTDPDMGYSYGRPLVVKTRKYGWVVIMTSGYNNNTGSGDGHGVLYVLNAKTGALLQKIDTGVGSVAKPAGLAQATGYTQDVSDGTIDQVYAGDLLGNVWRFDLSETAIVAGVPTPAYPAPFKLATLTDPGGNPQPITTAPRIELGLDSTGLGTLRYVFVGTGRFLDTSDLSDTQQQTMYTLRDGTGSTPSSPAAPLIRGVLTANPLITPIILGDNATGWYYDLPGKATDSGGTERIVVNPDAAAGVSVIAWATVTPSLDPCSLQGNIYAADFSTGQSALQDDVGNLKKSISTPSATTGLQIVQLPSGEYAILFGQTGSLPGVGKMLQPNPDVNLNRVNWREILN